MVGCNLTKIVPKGEQLLVHNSINRTEGKTADLSDEYDNLKQRPNRKILGIFKFHLWAYQTGNKGLGVRKKQGKIRSMLERIGEAPVLIDSSKLEKSARRLSEYYFSKGYLNNTVDYQISPKRNKKRAKVGYDVKLGAFHRINTIEYNAPSSDIDKVLKENSKNQMLTVGERLDFEDIEDERNRITDLLRNNGFYYFNNAFIDFQIDTNELRHYAKIVVNIRNNRDYQPHYQQTIDEIVVLIGTGINKDTIHWDKLKLVENSYYINPKSLAKNIIIRPDSIYNADLVQKTYANLLGMGLFDFVSIRFRPAKSDTLNRVSVIIDLKTSKKHDWIWEPQAILTDQNSAVTTTTFGLANSLTLRNRNVFGNGETFDINSFTALETQLTSDPNGNFNGFRQNVSLNLTFPSLVYFEKKYEHKPFTKTLTQKNTKLGLTYLYDRNVNYTRNMLPLSFTYNFNMEPYSFSITPFRLSVNQASIDPDFLTSLDEDTRTYTTQLLTNNIITGPLVSAYWSNIKDNPDKYWKIRSNLMEFSGNLFNAYYAWIENNNAVDKEVLGIKYSQYARTDLDATHTNIIDENNSVVYRFYGGVGVPYGNTRFLPYERRFFVGGGNSLRAWRARTIGPGGYNDPNNTVAIEKTGELLLQGNLEYRFDIIDKAIDGAVFADAGNVWNLKADTSFLNADFQFDRFYKEIALNTGFGLRFDFTYVIFRVDWGVALHDPSYSVGDRWVIKDFFTKRWVNENSALNFAIAYPF